MSEYCERYNEVQCALTDAERRVSELEALVNSAYLDLSHMETCGMFHQDHDEIMRKLCAVYEQKMQLMGKCNPGSRVRKLVESVNASLKRSGKAMTIHNFRQTANFVASRYTYITKESRRELEGQALRMWLRERLS